MVAVPSESRATGEEHDVRKLNCIMLDAVFANYTVMRKPATQSRLPVSLVVFIGGVSLGLPVDTSVLAEEMVRLLQSVGLPLYKDEDRWHLYHLKENIKGGDDIVA